MNQLKGARMTYGTVRSPVTRHVRGWLCLSCDVRTAQARFDEATRREFIALCWKSYVLLPAVDPHRAGLDARQVLQALRRPPLCAA